MKVQTVVCMSSQATFMCETDIVVFSFPLYIFVLCDFLFFLDLYSIIICIVFGQRNEINSRFSITSPGS